MKKCLPSSPRGNNLTQKARGYRVLTILDYNEKSGISSLSGDLLSVSRVAWVIYIDRRMRQAVPKQVSPYCDLLAITIICETHL